MLFWVVVDQLPVNEAVNFMFQYQVNFVFHLFLFSKFKFSNFSNRIYSHPRSKYFDFVGIHRSVSDQYFSIFYPRRLIGSNLFVQEKTFIQEGIIKTTSQFLDDLNSIEISTSLQSQYSIDS